MQHLVASFVLVLMISAHVVQSLSYDPADYLEVYPNPKDPEVLKGRTPLHFALIQSLGGQYSQFNASGSLAGVKVALDRINNDSSLLPGYTLHYTVANSQVQLANSARASLGAKFAIVRGYILTILARLAIL